MNNNVYINIDIDLELFKRLQKSSGVAGAAAVQSILIAAINRAPEPAEPAAVPERAAAAQ